MNKEFENKDQSGHRKHYQPEDLSLKGYYTIGLVSVIIGTVIVGILNLATPLQIISDRLAHVSLFSGPLFLLQFVPALLFLLLVYGLFRTMLSIILRPIAGYLDIVTTGGSLPEGLEEKARRRLLNTPFLFIPANMVMWIVVSAVPSLLGYLGGLMDFRTAVIICARTSMVGLISSFVASHRMEAYSRKKLIPFFFPRGRLSGMWKSPDSS